MHYNFQIHNDAAGLWAECIELGGCATQADDIEELKRNMEEALNLYLDEPDDSKTAFPLPDDSIKESDEIIKVRVDPGVAFAGYLRTLRINHSLTQKEVCEKLGFKHLYSYQRLESSKKANPGLKTLAKIKDVFPEFNLNLVI